MEEEYKSVEVIYKLLLVCTDVVQEESGNLEASWKHLLWQ